MTETYLKKGHDLEPDDLDIVIKLSIFTLNKDVSRRQWTFLLTTWSQDNVDPQLYWNLATSYARLEDYDRTNRYYQAAAPYFMDQADFLKPAVYFFREMGERDQMLKLLHAYVKVVPDDAEMAEILENEEENDY